MGGAAADPGEAAREVSDAVPGGPHRMQIGLREQPLEAWIPDQWDFDEQLAEHGRLLDTRDDVLAARAGSEAASAELLEILVEHLPRAFPGRYQRAGERIRVVPLDRELPAAPSAGAALEVAARLVPDDLCVMEADPQGTYRLTAAAVCFPTRWRLAPKMGESLVAIHGPVPGYAERLGTGVDRVFASLAPGRVLARSNWSLVDSPALYQPVRAMDDRGVPFEPEHLGERLWVRSERQSVRRLPRTGAVVFTIRIRQVTLAEACRYEGVAARLGVQLATIPEPLAAYKGIPRIRAALERYLETAATS